MLLLSVHMMIQFCCYHTLALLLFKITEQFSALWSFCLLVSCFRCHSVFRWPTPALFCFISFVLPLLFLFNSVTVLLYHIVIFYLFHCHFLLYSRLVQLSYSLLVMFLGFFFITSMVADSAQFWSSSVNFCGNCALQCWCHSVCFQNHSVRFCSHSSLYLRHYIK